MISLLLVGPARGVVFTVNALEDDTDAHDVSPGDGVCADSFGFCTLRAAIEESNARSGLDAVEFSVAGQFSASIGALPAVTDELVIDGTSAPGYNIEGQTLAESPPVVTLNGSGLSGSAPDGLRFSGAAAAFSEVRALAIVDFPDNGIQIDAGADSLRVDGCFIGIDASGAARGNGGDGLFAFDADFLILGQIYGIFTGEFLGLGNAIGSNGGYGISLFVVDSTTLFGNYIGVDPLSGGLRGNGAVGIQVVGDENVIGFTDPDENAGNLIVDSGSDGLVVSGDDNQIIGNRIGVLAGVAGAGNAGDGMVIMGNANEVGGANAYNVNHVSGNANGIRLGRDTTAATLTRVHHNEIGWFDEGTGNAGDGVRVDVGTGNEINYNLIVNNGGTGIFLADSGTTVIGNEIGVGGDLPAGNGEEGIWIDSGTEGNVIGGPSAEQGNIIGDNGGSGSVFAGIGVRGTHHSIRHNAIGVTRSGADVGNAYAGIDLFAENITVEDNWIGYNDNQGVRARIEAVTLKNNWIGVLPNGQTAGNLADGVVVGGADHVIGPGNRIQHNDGSGILTLSGTENLVVFENDIADHPLEGIALIDASAYIAGNRIRYNRNGVAVFTGTAVRVLANSLYNNLFLGIDLGGDGVTPNDAGDGDGGPNLTMNHPQIFGASYLPGSNQVEVMFSVDSDPANHTYPLRIDAYATDRDEPMQGRYWLGFDTYSTDGATETRTFDLSDDFVTGGMVALTATDADGNTSELSAPALFGQVDKIFIDGFEFP